MPATARSKLPPYTRLHKLGFYETRYPLYKGEDGKWKYHYARSRDVDEAWKAYAELEVRYGSRKLSREGDRQLEPFLAEFIGRKTTRANPVQPTTHAENVHMVGLICRSIGKVRLRELTPGHVWDMLDDLEPYAPRTRRHALRLLGEALRYAKARGWVSDVATEGVKLPREARDKRNKALELSRLQEYLRHARRRRSYPILALCAALGLRIGEAIALRREDYSKPPGKPARLDVRRTAQGRGKEARLVDRTKTPAGHRYIYLPPDVTAMLDEWLERLDSERELGAPASELLFPTTSGRAYQYHNVLRDHQDAMAAAGLEQPRPRRPRKKAGQEGEGQAAPPPRRKPAPKGERHVTTHQLRHTANSLMMQRGVMQEVRAAILGHSLTRNINDIYTHVQESDLIAAAPKLAGTLPPEWSYPTGGLLGKELGKS